MTNLDKKIRNAFDKEEYAQIILPLVGWILAFVTLYLHYQWAQLSQNNTNFQRAGAAIVCIDVVAFSLMTFFTNTVLSVAVIGGREPSKLSIASSISMAALAVVGTFVWGYGDIMLDILDKWKQ